jgi:hypothetical protein
MNRLKISPVIRPETARLSVTISKALMEAIELYVADFGAEFACEADIVMLVPQMLETFIRSDKAFMKRHKNSIREQAARTPSPLPSATRRFSDGDEG